VGNRWRAWVERILPWYDPEAARAHDQRTEAIRLRSIAAQVKSERVMAEYAAAEKRARRR